MITFLEFFEKLKHPSQIFLTYKDSKALRKGLVRVNNIIREYFDDMRKPKNINSIDLALIFAA